MLFTLFDGRLATLKRSIIIGSITVLKLYRAVDFLVIFFLFSDVNFRGAEQGRANTRRASVDFLQQNVLDVV